MKRHLACFPILLLLFAATLASCVKEGSSDPTRPGRTVLAYFGGDNNLSAETHAKIEAIRRGWRSGNGRLLIYCDAAGQDPRLLRLRGGCNANPTPYLETVVRYPEENSASADVFARVIADVKRSDPADSYGLLVFSHASGWLPAGTLRNPAGPATAAPAPSAGSPADAAQRPGTASIVIDDTPGRQEMELADFAAAIPDRAFDFIIFETCLTAGIEVAYALRNKTDYVLASAAEIVSPGFTPVYASAITELFATAATTERNLTGFASAWFDHITATGGWGTMSLVRTGGLDALAGLVRKALAAPGGRPDPATLQHFDRPGSYGDRPAIARFFDLGEYLEQVAPVSSQRAIADQLARTVVWKEATATFLPGVNGFTIRRHSGLTTYIEQEAFPYLNGCYRSTAWYLATAQQ